MKKIKILGGLLLFAAFIYVFINIGKVNTQPLQKSVDLTDTISDYSVTDNWTAVVAERKLFIADENGVIQKIVDLTDEGIFDYDCYDVAIDGDSILIYGTDHYDGTAYFSKEKLAKLNAAGELETYLYEIDHSKKEHATYLDELQLTARDGYAYWLNDEGACISLIRIPVDGENQEIKTETIAEFTVPGEAADGYFNIDQQKIYIQLISGDVYVYDLSQQSLKEDDGSADFDLLKEAPTHFSLSTKYFIWANLYYFSILLLGAGVLFLLVLFIRSSTFTKSRKTWIFALFLVVSVGVLTNQIVTLKQETAYRKISAIADVAIYDIEKKFNSIDNDFAEFAEYRVDDGEEANLSWCTEYLDSICSMEGSEVPLYMIAYVVNDEGKAFYLTSTDHNVYGGMESDTIEDIPADLLQQKASGRSYDDDDKDGLYHIEERYLYDADGNLKLILEVGSDSSSVLQDGISQALSVVISLAAILAVLWVVFDCGSRFRDDIAEYIRSKERRSVHVRLRLSEIYFFIVNFIMSLDYLLMVMVVAYISGEQDAIKLAAIMIIPVTAYRIGTWSGSVLVSTLIGKLGEKKSGILGGVITLVSFLLMAFACVIKNVYILAAAKILEGIFLESVMYSLAEGIPYELDDEEERASWLSRLHDSGNGAMIVGLMLAGLIAQYVGYEMLYIVGAVGAVILVFMGILMLRTRAEETADEGDDELEEDKGITGNAWFAFLKPPVLVYLAMFIVVYALMAGYEDYVFPLFSESCNISDTMLSNMGVIANLAAFVGIESILPKGKHSPLILMTGAFSVCGLALCFMFLQPSVIYAFVVLLIINFVGRILEDYKALELTKITDRYGYDPKEVQENYYAVEDGMKILQAPILGTLCNIAASVCCLALGLLCILVPGAYTLFNRKKEES